MLSGEQEAHNTTDQCIFVVMSVFRQTDGAQQRSSDAMRVISNTIQTQLSTHQKNQKTHQKPKKYRSSLLPQARPSTALRTSSSCRHMATCRARRRPVHRLPDDRCASPTTASKFIYEVRVCERRKRKKQALIIGLQSLHDCHRLQTPQISLASNHKLVSNYLRRRELIVCGETNRTNNYPNGLHFNKSLEPSHCNKILATHKKKESMNNVD
jgi:hypothetical protein